MSPPPWVLVIGGGVAGRGTQLLHKASVACFDIYASPETDFIADAHDIPLPRRFDRRRLDSGGLRNT